MSHRTITAGKEDEQGSTPLEIRHRAHSDDVERVFSFRLSAEEWRALEELAHEVNVRADG